MKLRFIDPNQILGAVLALMVLAVGVFATFVVFASIPTTTPVSSSARTGNGTLYDNNLDGLITNNTNPVLRWVPTPGFLNNTGVCVVWVEGRAIPGGAGGFDAWRVLQTVGAANGTFCANGTYRVGHIYGARNISIRVEYALSGQQTTALQNTTYLSVLNVSGTSTQVFNIVGVVLVIAAIMSIIALIYSYVKPRI